MIDLRSVKKIREEHLMNLAHIQRLNVSIANIQRDDEELQIICGRQHGHPGWENGSSNCPTCGAPAPLGLVDVSDILSPNPGCV